VGRFFWNTIPLKIFPQKIIARYFKSAEFGDNENPS
jgi:hypothetical protein